MYTSSSTLALYTLMIVTTPYFVGGTETFELMPAPILSYLEFESKDEASGSKASIEKAQIKGLTVVALFKED